MRSLIQVAPGIVFVLLAGFTTYAAIDAQWIQPHEFSARAIGLGMLLIATAGTVAMLHWGNRNLHLRNTTLEERIVALSDREWERQAADAANQAKSRFLAMVSHEIRTPLNGILGMADLLLETPLSPEQATYARAVKSSGGMLLSLIEEVLDFSKIEAGRLELDRKPFALRPLVEDTVELLAPRAQAKGIEIASFVDGRLPRCCMGDAARLRQVLLNLIGNAIKFTQTGGVSLVVEPASHGAHGRAIAFRIRDTGIGIAPDTQARIFREFEQADGGSARRFGGTGLGLAISKRLIEAMGGDIGVRSTTDGGSVFSCILTLPEVHATDLRDSGPGTVPSLAGLEVLIVSPSFVEAPLTARQLDAWGAHSRIAANETEARELLTIRGWNAVIVDGVFGRIAAERIGRLIGTRAERRLVLVTPADRADLPALKDAGFTGYLVKPVRSASLAGRFGADVPSESTIEPAFPKGEDAAAGRNGLAILVAEDNEINALLARNLLLRLGHRPIMAANGADAVEVHRTALSSGTRFDVILMDLHMPGMSGIEATERIRAAEQSANATRTPIVALTADALLESRDNCMAAGMNDFLTKPLDREQLAKVLANQSDAASYAA